MQLVPLIAGPLSMKFDPDLAFLRQVKFGDREVVRGIFAAVRDRDWNTVPFHVEELQIDDDPSGFSLEFHARCAQNDIRFQWRGVIAGTRNGSVSYKFQGVAHSKFLKNRIGLCVLHPIKECVDQACRVEHVDGAVTYGQFPSWISPHQPFKNMLSITHEVVPGVEAKITFQGDAFEMEDQRNWTDASFKTYSTPLALPFPVQVNEGDRISQEVAIELLIDENVASPVAAPKSSVDDSRITIDWNRGITKPPIGLSMAAPPDPPTRSVVETLRQIAPDHLRVDLHLTDVGWQNELEQAHDLASRIQSKLEVAVFAEEGLADPWERFSQRVRDMATQVARCLVFHRTEKSTTPNLVKAARESLPSSIPLVVGTNAYFAELNRFRPPVEPPMSVCFSINPQVHAFDKLSLRETLDAQRWAIESARHIFDCPTVVSPISLRPRFNPNATSQPGDPSVLEPVADPRQPTGFAAAWTVGTLRLASHVDTASLTFYETFGPRGVMSVQGDLYPVGEVFRFLTGSATVYPTDSTSPLDLVAVAVQDNDGMRLVVLGNLCDEPRVVSIESGDRTIQVEVDGESVSQLLGDQLV